MKFITYGNYIYFPILATAWWLATLLGLLLWWTVEDQARTYGPDEPTIIYISDSGAEHKWLFIFGTAGTLFFYASSLLLERWLRHVDRIPGTLRSREWIFDTIAIFFGIAGGFCLLFLSIFDAFTYSRVHWSLTVGFIVCIALSAIFQTLEIWALKQDHPDRMHLRRNALIKVIVVGFAVIVAICFGGLYGACGGNATSTKHANCNAITSAAAACEWVVAFIFDIYLATFILDLWPAAKTSPRHARRHEKHLREKGLLHSDSPNMSATGFDSYRPSTESNYYPTQPQIGRAI